MNLLNELKFLLRILLIHFYQSEVKEAYGALFEIKRNLHKNIIGYSFWNQITNNLERKIILNPKWFINSINKNGLKPREAVYIWCFNNAKNELECTDILQLTKRDELETTLEFLSTEIEKIKKHKDNQNL